MADLLKQLKDYAAGPLYPMHMPGHKRQLSPAAELPCGWDMTEVTDLDDLHEAEGILKDAMDRTARLFGAQQTWYLVNGSTCGLLAGIRALAPAESRILVARNCHKAVYHAIELGNLHADYLTPPIDKATSIYGSIRPADVAAALIAHPDTACVVITSPTYEGVISDIQSIANICHSHGVPLLVDEAHGAHLGLFPGWPESAVQLGADLVVQSAHKTLPSLTQTAFLHLGKGSLADPDEVERQLDIFETSSPSYPLMASLDSCTKLLTERGNALFSAWSENLHAFDRAIEPLTHFQVIGHGNGGTCPDFFAFDLGKLPVFCGGTEFTGTSLALALRQQFHFETEMACGFLTLGMTSIADSKEAILRFAQALTALDRQAEIRPMPEPVVLPHPGKATCTIAQALKKATLPLPLSEAVGRISAEYIWAYPPGVPLTAPGEEITEEFLSCAQALLKSGTRLHHSHCKMSDSVQVLA